MVGVLTSNHPVQSNPITHPVSGRGKTRLPLDREERGRKRSRAGSPDRDKGPTRPGPSPLGAGLGDDGRKPTTQRSTRLPPSLSPIMYTGYYQYQ